MDSIAGANSLLVRAGSRERLLSLLHPFYADVRQHDETGRIQLAPAEAGELIAAAEGIGERLLCFITRFGGRAPAVASAP